MSASVHWKPTLALNGICNTVCNTVSLLSPQGPPGTGKTRTIHALVEALARTYGATAERQRELGQILVCADTNAATDNIVEGVAAAGIDIVRLGQAAKVGCKLKIKHDCG